MFGIVLFWMGTSVQVSHLFANDVTFNALISSCEKGRQWQWALHMLLEAWLQSRSQFCVIEACPKTPAEACLKRLCILTRRTTC